MLTRGGRIVEVACRVGLASLVALTLGVPARAAADDKSGVSPNRLKLPKGPGSLEGVGENVTPELSIGLMAYGIPIDLPPGHNGHTPSLRLSYSSGGGASAVGFGWSLSVPSIERMTSRGLPKYVPDDLVAAGGGDELVAVSRSPDRVVYRWGRNGSGCRSFRMIDRVERPNGDFRYRVRVDCEERTDPVNDGKPGFLLGQNRRLHEITVLPDVLCTPGNGQANRFAVNANAVIEVDPCARG